MARQTRLDCTEHSLDHQSLASGQEPARVTGGEMLRVGEPLDLVASSSPKPVACTGWRPLDTSVRFRLTQGQNRAGRGLREGGTPQVIRPLTVCSFVAF